MIICAIKPVWSFNTQPPEGGCLPSADNRRPLRCVSTHSRPKAAANAIRHKIINLAMFQHTAARRRLHVYA